MLIPGKGMSTAELAEVVFRLQELTGLVVKPRVVLAMGGRGRCLRDAPAWGWLG